VPLRFATDLDLAEHFETHVTKQREFAVTTEAEYLALANAFLDSPLDPTTSFECQRLRKDGTLDDKIRYNRVTQEFGILSVANVIRTYYIPDPAQHGFRTNYDSYLWNCKRRKG
jgi:hypothetical protein